MAPSSLGTAVSGLMPPSGLGVVNVQISRLLK